ncbi:glycosyltransferase [uncultured Dubosiella sp.]|uniref:rhamnosyltransferase WsaF family glycosyltransferase n=2 Tax=uncultured Dubosiella sp. TaxID=1937011 RepID=UPI002080102D|nr:glycosyltransferase [uncultured Dubosiella sp.]GJM57295.1 glycosyl transferase family 1 [Erysipelotrichaceae bacterium OPF54]
MRNVKRLVRSLKMRGIKGSIQRAAEGVSKVDLIGFWSFIVDQEKIPFNKTDYENNKEKGITLNWVVPEMGKGSGGHINIFRFISYLERHGIHNRVYMYRAQLMLSNDVFRNFIKENFQILDENVELYWDVRYMKYAHGIVATSWETAYFVNRYDNVISKFYFIQDFEPDFYAKSSQYEFAENTYKMGFRGLTAGEWLRDICVNQYNMVADSFSFSYDKDLYTVQPYTGRKNRVFFYARPVTPRRDFELGMLALNELCKRMPEIEVVFAGWNIDEYAIPFKYKSLGILELDKLSALYASCDVCLVISNTNLSLLPLEVMGSGSVAVCSKGANSEWLVNESNSILVDYDPVQIAETIEKYLKDTSLLNDIREKGIEFAKSTSWEVEGEKVLKAVKRGIQEDEKNINNRG